MDERKKIFVDMDNCIVDTTRAIVELYNEDYAHYSDFKEMPIGEQYSWGFKELECATEEAINTYFNVPRFFAKLKMLFRAKETLEKLNKDYNIVVVSAGYSPNLRAKKRWLEDNLPFVDFIGVNFKYYSDKSHVDMSEGIAFIDDSTRFLHSSNCPIKILCSEKCLKGTVDKWNGRIIQQWNYDELTKIIKEEQNNV